MARHRLFLVILGAVCAFAVASLPAAHAWIVPVSGTANKASDAGTATVVDANDDAISVGAIDNHRAGTDFGVVKLSGGTGAKLWSYELAGSRAFDKEDVDPAADSAAAVVLDGSGDVIAAGVTDNLATGDDFTVAKLSGADGSLDWLVQIDGSASDDDQALAVTVDGSDNVIAAGVIDNGDPDFAVVKLSGATGAELWRYEFTGEPGAVSTQANAVTVDSNGDVIAVGVIDRGVNIDPLVESDSLEFAVVKLDGTTGAEDWRVEIDGTDTPIAIDRALAVAVNGSNDVIAVGVIDNDPSGDDFAVVKLDSTTGAEDWRTEIDGTESLGLDRAAAVAIDSNQDVVVAGILDDDADRRDFTVVKLDGGTGAEDWITQIDGTPGDPADSSDKASAVVLNGSDDVFAAGVLDDAVVDGSGDDFAVAKLQGSDGVVVWQRAIPGSFGTLDDPAVDEAVSVALDGSGDVITAGWLENDSTRKDLMTVKLAGVDGGLGVQGVAARKIQIKDAVAVTDRKITFATKGPEIVSAPLDSTGDPRCSAPGGGGATLDVFSTGGSGESVSISLPCARWQTIGPEDKRKGYKYKDKDQADGPCQKVQIKNAKSLKLACSGKTPASPLNYDLTTGEGSVGVILTTGDLGYCAEFTAGTVRGDDATGFKAKGGPVPLDCPSP